MSIRFSCSCGRKLKVSDEKIGMKVLCSSCGATLKVPKKSQDEFWQDVPTQSGEPSVDYIGALKEVVFKFVPGLIVLAGLVWFAYFLSSQVIGGRANLPPLGKVSGKVTLEGQPLAGATVKFIPLPEEGEKERKKASVALGLTGEDGRYILIYVKDVFGAAVGKTRVEIEAKDSNGKERIRSDFNGRSTLVRDVPAGSSEQDFDVQPVQKTGASATPVASP